MGIDIEAPGGSEADLTAALRALNPLVGARVRKSADQTTANYTTLSVVAWGSEDYDTDGFHDNVTNNSRLTIPAALDGASVILTGFMSTTLSTANTWQFMRFRKNGSSTFDGNTSLLFDVTDPEGRFVIISGRLIVATGDYFEVEYQQESDTSITVYTSSFFELRVSNWP